MGDLNKDIAEVLSQLSNMEYFALDGERISQGHTRNCE